MTEDVTALRESATPGGGVTSSPKGGLSARATRTREAIVDALLTLIDDGNLRPTAREIAAQAGVSLRSVYVHFDDIDDLFHAAATRHFEKLEPIVRHSICDDDAPFEERLDGFVDRRARIYEASANIARAAALQEPFSPAMRGILDSVRRFARAHVDAVFAPELDDRDSERGARQRSGLEVVSGMEAWDVMCRRQGLSLEAAEDVMRGLIRAVLAENEAGT